MDLDLRLLEFGREGGGADLSLLAMSHFTVTNLGSRILDPIIDALSSFSSMSQQALQSAQIRLELTEILLGPAGLYEALRAKGAEVRRQGRG